MTGYPIPVTDDGTVALPMVDPIKVQGLTVREAEKAVGDKYIQENILRPSRARPMITLVPKAQPNLNPPANNNGRVFGQELIEKQLFPLMLKRYEMELEFGPSHPTVRSLGNEIVGLERELREVVAKQLRMIEEAKTSARGSSETGK
ncbi:MAG: polysaccharide biosynthesis/export family protein [Planctomycetota bacterium]